jgi:hypothetical protein
MLTCIHATTGLCPQCQEEYNEDPLAFLEFGQHTAGIANWAALQAEMLAEREEELPASEVDESIPF